MKFLLFVSFVVTLSYAQKSLAFCDEYIEFDISFYGKFISNVKLSNTTDAILADYRIMIIDNELNVLSSISIPKTNNSTCSWIFTPISGYFFIGCQKGADSPYLIAYKSINETHYSQFGDIVQFPIVNSTVIKITGSDNTLFTVETTKVTLFTLVMSAADWSIKTTQNVLDKNYFSRTSEINITDITFLPYVQDSMKYLKIMVTEFNVGSFWIDALVKNNIVSPFRTGNIFPNLSWTKYQSVTIHSTTSNVSMISMTYYTTQNSPMSYKVVVNSVASTSLTTNFLYTQSGWQHQIAVLKSGNVEAIMYRNPLKQTILYIYICSNSSSHIRKLR
ncbi:unnamed protein product (macronuclear) [Paramecium tetraurelia]|uniref:LTD domain-containing protein n=1 Tax=Paramecium tetraurelia TaxID=5888 RepID=A0ED70_PARTE|nr:uncharacterized protein GSPATT00004106001 [Paramecium tetraurelia]CAK93237.1 unnamed protein product [Paramecium tetraurelia]|eukprot:XP_001460634.1 hypothetical protein (macronuclear) [Paramecium tetraurelia strain d4-2]